MQFITNALKIGMQRLATSMATATAGGVVVGAGGFVITETGRRVAVEALKGVGVTILAKEISEDLETQEKCNKCDSYNLGHKLMIKRTMGDRTNTYYQAYIANIASLPLKFNSYPPYIKEGNTKETTQIEEWKLKGVAFDGLWPTECMLVEAKGMMLSF